MLTNGVWCGNINELSARGQRRKAKKWLNKAKNAVLHHGRPESPTLERIEKRLKKCLTKSGRHDIINKLFREGSKPNKIRLRTLKIEQHEAKDYIEIITKNQVNFFEA